eukprot:gnl/MRDRNA2_/MRDRNA2_36859_c0_seq1.p1 gnl/MRDRNA2_/MRDRNA2_36859_c0~~gnl/MRDRNA2_/MRDRNA2_36859_c0_seq1.p1  ORF type:complete len:101 (+),score=10.90 gnl/MRDRNA2_/MRDRNA2_36859_c0_seq1:452-754(+)
MVISACERGAQWQKALTILQAAVAEKILLDAVSYGVSICACRTGTHWDFALELLDKCKAASTPQTITYSASISACEKGGRWHQVLIVLDTMLRDTMKPDT